MVENEHKEGFSYSRLEKFNQCPYAYKLRYKDKNYSSTSSLAMELGEIAHKCKELVALDLMKHKSPNYDYIVDILFNGYDATEDDVKSGEHGVIHISGVNELKRKYPLDWIGADNKSGLDYEQKIAIFRQHLRDMENDTVWRPIAAEKPFEFLFDGKYLIKGFIDKIDMNECGDLRVVDYKTSKAVFEGSKVKTSMQMVIYDMAIRHIYGKAPVEHMFDFIFIGKTQKACSPGYYTRGEKKLREWFSKIEEANETGEYVPNPSPLCHWCDYCMTNPNAQADLKTMCRYHSLWTPNNKIYNVAEKYNPGKKIDFWF